MKNEMKEERWRILANKKRCGKEGETILFFSNFLFWGGGWEEEEERGNWQALRRGSQESESNVLFSLLCYFSTFI